MGYPAMHARHVVAVQILEGKANTQNWKVATARKRILIIALAASFLLKLLRALELITEQNAGKLCRQS